MHFYWHRKYHKRSYRGGGWQAVGSHEVVGKSPVKTENSKMASTGVILNSTYHTKQLNQWPTSPASYVVIYLQVAVCLSRGDGAI